MEREIPTDRRKKEGRENQSKPERCLLMLIVEDRWRHTHWIQSMFESVGTWSPNLPIKNVHNQHPTGERDNESAESSNSMPCTQRVFEGGVMRGISFTYSNTA